MAEWWNDVELWLATIPFALQFTLVMAVLLPLCLGVAWLIDRAVDYASDRFGSRREPPIDAE